MASPHSVDPAFFEKQRKLLEVLCDGLIAAETQAADAESDSEATRRAEAQKHEETAQALERQKGAAG